MAVREYGQYDGVTRALELVGERWALLIVRDLLVGPRRYGELAAGLPRIPSNILAARLKELQAAGVIRRVPRLRVVVEEDHSAFMLLTREYFQTFTDLPLGDPAVSPSVSTAIFLDSRDAVDATAAAGLVAGGTEPRPASDYGFMYQRGLTDPDGNVLEFGWMDPAAAEQGPEAVASQQA